MESVLIDILSKNDNYLNGYDYIIFVDVDIDIMKCVKDDYRILYVDNMNDILSSIAQTQRVSVMERIMKKIQKKLIVIDTTVIYERGFWTIMEKICKLTWNISTNIIIRVTADDILNSIPTIYMNRCKCIIDNTDKNKNKKKNSKSRRYIAKYRDYILNKSYIDAYIRNDIANDINICTVYK